VDWFEEKEARREADRYAAREEEYMIIYPTLMYRPIAVAKSVLRRRFPALLEFCDEDALQEVEYLALVGVLSQARHNTFYNFCIRHFYGMAKDYGIHIYGKGVQKVSSALYITEKQTETEPVALTAASPIQRKAKKSCVECGEAAVYITPQPRCRRCGMRYRKQSKRGKSQRALMRTQEGENVYSKMAGNCQR